MSRRDKEEFKSNLARVLHKNKLNGAEESIINNFYQIIGALSVEKIGTNAEDQGEKSNNSIKNKEASPKTKKKNKLEQIAELLKDMLEQKFKEKANYIFEAKFKWLTHVPDKETFKPLWEDISGIYSG